MPCFEGLLPEPFNTFTLDLLYDLAVWLSYGKLRQHTDSTLASFEAATTSLGFQIRKFANKTSAHWHDKTKETPHERTRRERRAATKRAKEVAAAAAAGRSPPPEKRSKTPQERFKLFSLRTYKLHALGDYIRSIRLFGTTDSYSTQIASSCLFCIVCELMT